MTNGVLDSELESGLEVGATSKKMIFFEANQSAERNRFILLTQRCFSFCRSRRSKREGGLEGVGAELLSLEAKRIRLGRRDRASRILFPIISTYE